MTEDADAGTDPTPDASAGGDATTSDRTFRSPSGGLPDQGPRHREPPGTEGAQASDPPADNRALLQRIAELEAANDDLANLIASTDVAMLFLDERLRVRRCSDRATTLIKAGSRPAGRPLADLALRVKDRALLADAHRVLRRLVPIEAEVPGPGGSWYARRIVPYRTSANRIEGVVVTYAEVTRLRHAVDALEERSRRQASVAELGGLALGSEDLQALLDRAVRDVAERLDAPLVEIQQIEDSRVSLVLRAGEGWARGLVGQVRTPMHISNHAGYALQHPSLVLVSDFRTETRFDASELLRDHDVLCGASALIGPGIEPWGLIGAYREEPRPLEKDAAAYLQAMGNILWLAVVHERSRRAQEEERQELRQLIDGLPVMVGVLDRQLRFEIGNRAFEALGWIAGELDGERVEDVIGREAFERGREGFETVLSGRSTSFELTLGPGGARPRIYLVHNEPRRSGGTVTGFFFVMIDITERKRYEERNAVISAELDHRVKNILALVTTISRMTGRTTEDFETFSEVFEDRIHSLARTHAALAEADWAGMDLQELLASELAAYVDVGSDRVRLEGAPMWLGRRATQSLALAFHELVTNAVKYGAFSRPEGRLAVSWRRSEDGWVSLAWVEHGLSGVRSPTREGYGRTVIETAVLDQLRGEVRFEFGGEGLVCSIRIPDDALVEDGTDG